MRRLRTTNNFVTSTLKKQEVAMKNTLHKGKAKDVKER